MDHYIRLFLKETWRVKRICDGNPLALDARITVNWDTALHIAVGNGRVNHIVTYLENKMSKHQLIMKNSNGDTALSIAAIVGNTRATTMIFSKNRNLPQVANHDGRVPLLEAARHSQKQMIYYLLEVSGDYLQAAEYSADKPGVFFMNLLVLAEFYDLALELVQGHLPLATVKYYGGESLLSAVASKPSAFPSGCRQLRFWHQLIYSCVPIKSK